MTSVAVHRKDGAVTSVEVKNVLCLGRTYRAHAKELNNPVPREPIVFLKSTRALRGLEQGPLACADEEFHHEAELVLLIGRTIALGETGAWADVEAIGLGIDLTRRGVQNELKKNGHPWTTAKSFEGAALVSPLRARSEVESEVEDLDALPLSLRVNGELRQDGSTSELERPVPGLLTHLASFVPLGPGDLVFTGTPKGVGPIRRGDGFVLASPVLGEFPGTL